MATFPSLESVGPTSLQLADSLSSLGDKEPDFVNASDSDRFKCAIHGGLLREPLQTKCGHRLCLRCFETYLGGATKKRCPVGESDCEDISKEEVLRDNSIIRDIRKSLIYCHNKPDGCTAKIRFEHIKDHLNQCEHEEVSCMFAGRGCEEKVKRGKLSQHRSVCPYSPVRCSSCRQEINQGELQDHTSNACPEGVTGCPFGCGDKKLKRKEVPAHRNTCPVQPVDCKFKHMGCKFTDKRERVERHEKDEIPKHLELVTVKVAALEVSSLDTQQQLQALSAERENLQRNLQSSRGQDEGTQTSLLHLDNQIKELKLKIVSVMEKVITVERKIPEMAEQSRVQAVEQNMTRIQQKIRELEQAREREQQQRSGAGGGQMEVARNARVGQYGNVDDMAVTVRTQLEGHDRQLSVHDIRMAEMDLRFQLLETASYDGKLVWKIRDYQRRKNDAVNNRTLSLYSQPFYTNRFGYKMCARVYLNGDGMGKTTHLSLFFVVMRGEYDALLVWPFRQKVTLTLLDQSSEKRHLTDHFQPDPNSSSFQRPVSEMNVASGCPLFVSHSVLENQTNGYLKDDTIFIRIVVDETATSAPF